ncbi:MAG: hypothetical protein LBC83_02595 [Oscillospiraceae bacterium]|nr:hypothetical protein [Oscillospiraceae bacterium]
MQQDVGPAAGERLREQIQEKIYDVYTPVHYQRRRMLGRSVTPYLPEPGATWAFGARLSPARP